MSRDEQFRHACEDWIRSSLSLLQDKDVPQREEAEVALTADGGWQSSGTVLAPDYVRLLLVHHGDLVALPAVAGIAAAVAASPPAAAALLVDAAGEPISPDNQRGWLFSQYFHRFAATYLMATRSVAFVPEHFDRLYAELEQFIYSPESIDVVWLVQFHGLSTHVEPIPLDPGATLRRATEEERLQAAKELTFPGAWPFLGIPEAFLEVRGKRTTGTTPPVFPDPEAAAAGDAVLLALRLIKPGALGIAAFRQRADNPFVRAGGMSFSQSRFPGEPYVVTAEVARELRALWPRAKRASRNSELSIPLTRLDDSYSRRKPEDRLIDYWIALEALFSPPEDVHAREMGDMYALAVSFYLGHTAGNRRGIYNDIKRSWGVRSHIVHAKRGQPKLDLEEAVSKTATHLRAALRQWIAE